MRLTQISDYSTGCGWYAPSGGKEARWSALVFVDLANLTLWAARPQHRTEHWCAQLGCRGVAAPWRRNCIDARSQREANS